MRWELASSTYKPSYLFVKMGRTLPLKIWGQNFLLETELEKDSEKYYQAETLSRNLQPTYRPAGSYMTRRAARPSLGVPVQEPP